MAKASSVRSAFFVSNKASASLLNFFSVWLPGAGIDENARCYFSSFLSAIIKVKEYLIALFIRSFRYFHASTILKVTRTGINSYTVVRTKMKDGSCIERESGKLKKGGKERENEFFSFFSPIITHADIETLTIRQRDCFFLRGDKKLFFCFFLRFLNGW
ncbi:hypothetical protein [Chitinophaga filiformis]|uniref:hypothetical protein n=1 Tax=Chitinophaga filiformis TaxID=104663 RepID=UPI0015A074A5|nr:hypothetical protein [Chitinophaga filiformis]